MTTQTRRLDTRRGHSPLELGNRVLRPWVGGNESQRSISATRLSAARSIPLAPLSPFGLLERIAGSWKPFLNAHWGFTQGSLACESTLHYSPDPLPRFTRLLRCTLRCWKNGSELGNSDGKNARPLSSNQSALIPTH
jgi:hypothetical protein